jgi:hypothetical protein
MGIIERALSRVKHEALVRNPATGCYHRIGGLEICRENGLALRKFNGGGRPLPIMALDMALDRDLQAVKFVKPDILYRTSLSVREDHGLSDKLRAILLERAEYGRGEDFSFHGCSLR